MFKPAALAASALLAACLLQGCGDDRVSPPAAPSPSVGVPRIVSINPSLTAIVLALGARDALVGIDEFSAAQQPALAHLPRVGGLFNPSLEGVAALTPDVVVLVPSVEQRDFRDRLEQLGVDVIAFDNIRFEDVLRNITEIGALVGREREAAARVRAIRASRAAAERLAAGKPAQRTAMVLQRDPVFVVGSGGFLDELLESIGAENLGARLEEEYPQVAVEWLVDAQPELLIDMTDEPGDPLAFWSRWPAIPAVASRRVLHLDPKTVTLPGPYLDRSIAALAGALHGEPAAASLLASAQREAALP